MWQPENICWMWRLTRITRFEQEFFTFLDKKYPEVPKAIRTEKVISDETDALLKKAIDRV